MLQFRILCESNEPYKNNAPEYKMEHKICIAYPLQ